MVLRRSRKRRRMPLRRRRIKRIMRYRKKRRLRRRKPITKRGVKQLIALNAAKAGSGPINLYFQYAFRLSGTFGEAARRAEAFNYTNALEELKTITAARYPPAATNTYVDSTDVARYQKLHVKTRVIWQIHSTCNEVQEITIWRVRAKQDMELGFSPLEVWTNEYAEQNALLYYDTTTDITIANFVNAFQTFPTQYREWNKRWKIVKKTKASLLPGQTVKYSFKIPYMQYQQSDQDPSIYTTAYIKNKTECILMQLKGVPTAQAADENIISTSSTGIDANIYIHNQCWLSSTNVIPMSGHASKFGTVTSAESIQSAYPQTLLNNI